MITRKNLQGVSSLSISDSGADWYNGVVAVNISTTVTAEIASEVKKIDYGKVEIEVTLSSGVFTWFAPVRLIPGYID